MMLCVHRIIGVDGDGEDEESVVGNGDEHR